VNFAIARRFIILCLNSALVRRGKTSALTIGLAAATGNQALSGREHLPTEYMLHGCRPMTAIVIGRCIARV
jgi:hypothetical protein